MSEPKFTPGPWAWFGNIKHDGPYLATVNRGRTFVMGFKRLGMRSAQPQFRIDSLLVDGADLAIYEVCRDATKADDERVYRHDIVGFRAPDAYLIAAAPTLYEALADAVELISNAAANADDGKYRDIPAMCDEVLPRYRAALAKARGEGL